MAVALLIARLLLAVVFVVAGISKLADRGGSRRALVEFGVPEKLAGPGAVVLPLAELVVAALLLPARTAAVGAAGALALLSVFTVAIAVNLLRGRTPDCHCFGAVHSEPAGPKTLARNAALAGVAAFVAVVAWNGDRVSATAWIGRLNAVSVLLLAAGLALAALFALGAIAFIHLLRQQGRLLLRLDRMEQALADAGFELKPDEMPQLGPPPGTPAPEFALEEVDGGTITLRDLLQPELPLLLFFTSPTCGPCRGLMPTVATWQRDWSNELTVALVSAGEQGAVRREAQEYGLARMLLDESHSVYTAYQANGTPSAVLVSPDGTIGSWMASGADWVERLVADTVGVNETSGMPVGAPAPALELSDLEGRSLKLPDELEADTVLLFWNPSCGFCRSMHEDLLAWEVETGAGAPKLVVLSSGEPESVRAEGFRSRVALDPTGEASSAFEAGGTPMAVLLDRDGRVASSLVAGADDVFGLLRARIPAS